jgi:hypothetical protein
MNILILATTKFLYTFSVYSLLPSSSRVYMRCMVGDLRGSSGAELSDYVIES